MSQNVAKLQINFGSGNNLMPSGKPLTEQTLTQTYVVILCHKTTVR